MRHQPHGIERILGVKRAQRRDLMGAAWRGRSGGRRCIIARIEDAVAALRGEAGTQIVSDEAFAAAA